MAGIMSSPFNRVVGIRQQPWAQSQDGASSNSSIIEKLQKAQKRANKANRKRYRQGLKELQGGRESLRSLYDTARQQVQNVGQTAFGDISQGATRAAASGQQQLISGGMGNTSIQASLLRGVEEDRRRAMERAEESRMQVLSGINERQAGQEFGMAGNISDFIAARNDLGPDVGLYAQLAQQAAGQQQGPITASIGAQPGQSLWQQSQMRQRMQGAVGSAPQGIPAGAVGSAPQGATGNPNYDPELWRKLLGNAPTFFGGGRGSVTGGTA